MEIILNINGSVNYNGRASSILKDGDYVIIIKSDKSLQVQGAKYNKPLNYINYKEIKIENNKIIAKSKKEEITITINKKYWTQKVILSDNIPDLKNSESDLVEKLINNTNLITTDEILNLEREYKTKYGNIDVYIETKSNKYIIEVKRHRISINSCKQIQKYLECINGIGILCAPKIISSALEYCNSNNLKYLKLDFDNVWKI